LKNSYWIDVRWIAFPLHPEISQEGQSLEELFSGRTLNLEEMRRHMKRVADMEGLPMGDRTMTYNTRLAQELGKWAESQGMGDEFHNRVFRAYFAEGKNIGKISELVALAGEIGLSGTEAQEVIETRSFREAVDRDWEHSRAKNVTAVPSFIMDSQAVVGAQPYETLEQFLTRNGVKSR
jgi:predicted DsbA family dithiol-disulfide isomerase